MRERDKTKPLYLKIDFGIRGQTYICKRNPMKIITNHKTKTITLPP